MTLKYIWRSFSLGCHFHVHFTYPRHAFASHGLPAVAELLVFTASGSRSWDWRHCKSRKGSLSLSSDGAKCAFATWTRPPAGWIRSRDSNPGITNPGITRSRPIFSIPNPGIGAALILGFRAYEIWTKCPNVTWFLPEKNTFSWILEGNSRLKLWVSGLDPNTNYVIMVDIVLRIP